MQDFSAGGKPGRGGGGNVWASHARTKKNNKLEISGHS